MNAIPLGAHVAYHHRAAVARYAPNRWSYQHPQPCRWVLTEGVSRGECVNPKDPRGWSDLRDRFRDQKPRVRTSPHGRGQQINKTIMVWPESGEGVVIAHVRRATGVSTGSRGEGEDYVPGAFHAIEWHWLYAVKRSLSGMSFVFVPEWAIRRTEAS